MYVKYKEKFGYVYVCTDDRVFKNILGAFCEGHGYWWNAFFGWRRTRTVKASGVEFSYYWIPAKKLYVLTGLAKEIKQTLDK